MKFFFPDSQDQIDPRFDFISEQWGPHRVRQRDDLYPHEALAAPPYDGMLISKPTVDGTSEGTGKYTIAQRHRIYRNGIHRFLRLDLPDGRRLKAMGDCGAFSYVRDEQPPYEPEEVVNFYEECGFDYGFSIDHAILDFDQDADNSLFSTHTVAPQWVFRQKLTLELAAEFLDLHRKQRCHFIPIGVAQGWSPGSYAHAVEELQRIGYRRIALGGMVPLKNSQVLSVLAAVDIIRDQETQLHLLGLTRTEHLAAFAQHGVTSFDSTSPFRRALKDDRDNYWTSERTYTAIRVPQVDGNPRLKRRIAAGQIDQGKALDLEKRCLESLRGFDAGEKGLGDTVTVLRQYEELYDGRTDHEVAYTEILEDRPWKRCECGICANAGIDTVIFRGTERNKRRGFHNLYVFNKNLQQEIEALSEDQGVENG